MGSRSRSVFVFGGVLALGFLLLPLVVLLWTAGWTLWGAIQARISAVDYDFKGYYTDRWERALEVLRSERLKGWMTEAAH